MKLAQPIMSHRDSLKIARRFNAGYGLACASSPGGTAESARSFIQRKDAKAQRRQGTANDFFATLRLCVFALKNKAALPELQPRWDWNTIHLATQN